MAEIALLPCNSCSTSGKPSPFGIFTSYASPEIRVLTVQGINRFLSTVWCAQSAAEPSVGFQIRGSNLGYYLFSFCSLFEPQLPNSGSFSALQPLSNDVSVLPSQVCKIDMSPNEDCLSFPCTPIYKSIEWKIVRIRQGIAHFFSVYFIDFKSITFETIRCAFWVCQVFFQVVFV